MVPIESLGMVSYSTSIVTMAVSCIVSKIQRDIGQKSWFFSYPLHSSPRWGVPVRILPNRLVRKKLEWCRYPNPTIKKTSMICLAVSIEYRRVTDGRTDRRTDILQRHTPHYAWHRVVKIYQYIMTFRDDITQAKQQKSTGDIIAPVIRST